MWLMWKILFSFLFSVCMQTRFGVMSEAWSAGLLHGHPGAGGGGDGPRGAGAHADHGYIHLYKSKFGPKEPLIFTDRNVQPFLEIWCDHSLKSFLLSVFVSERLKLPLIKIFLSKRSDMKKHMLCWSSIRCKKHLKGQDQKLVSFNT